MKRLLTVLLVLVGAAAVGYVSILGYALWDFRERNVVLPARTGQPLTEDQAVELTREALRRVGEDTAQFRPRPYDGTRLYARNTLTPYSGYVLWASTGSHPGFCVHLEQASGEIRCGVSRCK